MRSVMEKVPSPHPKLRFISRGATSWVYRVHQEELILKLARDQAIEAFQRENAIYNELEQHEPSPYLLQSITRRPFLNFLPVMRQGSLEQRIKGNQRRKPGGEIEVFCTVPRKLAEQWAMEIAGAVAWLETLGYVHGDLRPANLLLDETDHLKLADFDSVSRIGSTCFGNAPPWARVQGIEAGADEGKFGTHGARTEQFAFGSILYTITRGFEPYEHEHDSVQVVEWLQNSVFPILDDTEIDGIVDRCWRGWYHSINDLFQETVRLEGAATLPRATILGVEDISALREQCNRLLDGELKDVLGEFGPGPSVEGGHGAKTA